METAKILRRAPTEELFNNLQHDYDVISSVCSLAVADKITRLEQINKDLENNNRSLEGQLTQAREDIETIKKLAEDKVKKEEARFEKNKNIQKGRHKEIKRDLETDIKGLELKNNKLEAELKNKESLIVELETQHEVDVNLLISRDEEIERLVNMDKKLDTILETVLKSLDTLGKQINSNLEKTELIKTIEETKDKITKRPTKDEKLEKYRMIHELREGGMSNNEIAEAVFPGLKRGTVKVSEYINSKGYKDIYGWFKRVITSNYG